MAKQLRKSASQQMQVDNSRLREETMLAAASMLKRYTVYGRIVGPRFRAVSQKIKRQIFDPSKRRFAALCSLIGASPSDEFLKNANVIRDLVKEGKAYHFGGLADFSRDDLPLMDELIGAVEASEEKFSAASKKEMDRVLAGMARKEVYVPDLFIHGKHYPLGAWASIRKQKPIVDGGCFDEVLNISVPIVPGKDIKIEIKTTGTAHAWWERKLAGNEILSDFDGKICTFPEEHALFSGMQLAKHENGVYTFVTRYAGKGTAPVSKGKYRALREKVKESIPQKALAGLMAVVAEIKFVKIFNSSHPLALAFSYLRKKSTGESVDFGNNENLGYLVDRLMNEKAYPGDCKSVSTMSVGLATCMGYVARRVSGEVITLEGNEISDGGGHVWAEILQPEKNIWMPFDPAQKVLLEFPKDNVYMLHDEIPKSLAPFEIRVSHE